MGWGRGEGEYSGGLREEGRAQGHLRFGRKQDVESGEELRGTKPSNLNQHPR